MRNLGVFQQLFGTNNISLIFALLALTTSLLYVQQSAARGVPAHRLRDVRYPSPRLVSWGRRIRSTEGHQHQHQPAYTINRPAHCGQNETLYIDCFLCGKVTDEALIYRYCCERETATVRFCAQLLL